MQFTDFPERNHVLGAAKEDEAHVGALPVHLGVERFEDGREVPTITSKWVPTEADIQALMNGGGIWLTMFGVSHPPVRVSTQYPFNFG